MRRLHRREFMKLLGGSAAAVGLGGVARLAEAVQTGRPFDKAQDRPNILYIMSDDHARHALSCYGSRINQTPQLDRIAKEGMRFGNCFCTNSICAPCRAVVLTGKYSHLNGVIDNRLRFDGGQQHVAKLLRKAGYQTAMIGKWHLKTLPTGFDYFFVLPGQGAYHNPTFKDNSQKRVRLKGYVTDLITDKAIDWLKQRPSTGSGQAKPFFLMCHHKAPHRNWQPDARHARMYEDVEIPEPETFWDDYRTRCDAARQQRMHMKDLNARDLKTPVPKGLDRRAEMRWRYQRYIKDYLRVVASVDDNVGRLLDYLKQAGLEKNTVVVYTSDQGFFLGDHGWFDKRFMYEETLSMPLLVRYPKEVPAGSVNDDIVLNLDFAETFLDYAGAAVPADMQGRSLRGVLAGKTPADWRKSMYYHYYEYPGAHSVKRHYGVRTRRYKLIHFYYDIDAWELFDLQKDPHELNNVYDNPAYAGVVKELQAELKRLRKKYGDSDELAKKLLPQWRRRPPKRKGGGKA